VNIPNITLSGTASDGGKGDSGISQVTVNGVRAANDSASGSGTANWNRVLTLVEGSNPITVIAYDNSTNLNSTSQSITINYTPPCPVPGAPGAPSPANSAGGVSVNPTLSWAGTADTDSYDVYFGTAASPPLVTNTANTSYNPTGLTGSMTYYWKILPRNNCGQSTAGPVWSFTTRLAANESAIPFTVLLDGSPFANMEWGWKSGGMDNYDTGIDALAPPAAIDGDDAYFLSITGQATPFDKLRKDFRSVAEEAKIWKLVLKVADGKSLKLQWDPQVFPADWNFTIQDATASWVGIGPVINLNSSPSEVILDNETGDLLTRRYLVRASQGFPLFLKAGGWNLISLPLEPLDPAPTAVFGSSVLAVYEWNAVGRLYVEPTVLQAKKGYWVAVSQDVDPEVTVVRPAYAGVHLLTGWNLVGPTETGPAPSGAPVLAVYGWGWPPNYQYVVPDQCEEGKGYWIAASGEGEIW
jgi:hypothetical protein